MSETRCLDATELAVGGYLAVFRGETARAYAGDLRELGAVVYRSRRRGVDHRPWPHRAVRRGHG
jgi:hypothetical protein